MRCRFVIGMAAAAARTALLRGDSAAGARTHGAIGSGAAASGGTWGTAEEVPGTAALNPRGHIGITPVLRHQVPGIGRPGEASETG